MFLPWESLLSAAAAEDPELFDHALKKRVLLTTPMTLMALLKTVAFSWTQETLAENVREISHWGQDLYERISTMGSHMLDLRNSLRGSVEAYDKFVGSLEHRVLVSARKFKELGAANSGDEIAQLSPLDQFPRELQATEFKALPDKEKSSEDG